LGRINFLITLLFIALQSAGIVSCSGNKPEVKTVQYPFDDTRAFSYITAMTDFGSRIPGTEAHLKTREWIVSKLKEYTPNVEIQEFKGLLDGKETAMYNIVASFYPEKKNRVLLCAHWDSRAKADRDPDETLRSNPVIGANDGASGVAVLLEACDVFKSIEPEKGVDIVFFDGEDNGDYGSESGWILGSKYYAEKLTQENKPSLVILLDMIGDSDLALTQESNSMSSAPGVWDYIIGKSAELGINISLLQETMTDDHIPFIQKGIPSIDFIDFEYPYWHTVSDTPDKCSPGSLGKIGKLVLSIIYEMR